jgi:hypothetical protein
MHSIGKNNIEVEININLNKGFSELYNWIKDRKESIK